jgi:drug/metabolite transporter (DMT)-like permease
MAERPDEAALLRQTRTAAIVIAVAGVLWLVLPQIGSEIGLPTRYVFLIDFAALAAFFWALVVLFRVWRQRQRMGD